MINSTILKAGVVIYRFDQTDKVLLVEIMINRLRG